MLKITLRQADGTKKTYSQDFISGRMFRRTIEIQKLMQAKPSDPDTLNETYNYFSEVFGNQFTAEEFEDGIDSREMTNTIGKYITVIVGGAEKAIGSDGTESPN